MSSSQKNEPGEWSSRPSHGMFAAGRAGCHTRHWRQHGYHGDDHLIQIDGLGCLVVAGTGFQRIGGMVTKIQKAWDNQ